MTTCDIPNRDIEHPHLSCPFCLPDAPLPDSPMACPFWKRGTKCVFYTCMLRYRDEKRKQQLIRRQEKTLVRKLKSFFISEGHLIDDYSLFEAGRRRHEREQQGMKR